MNDMRHAARLVRQRADRTYQLTAAFDLSRNDKVGDRRLRGVDGFELDILSPLPSAWATAYAADAPSLLPGAPDPFVYSLNNGPVHPSDHTIESITGTSFGEMPSPYAESRLGSTYYGQYLLYYPFRDLDASYPAGPADYVAGTGIASGDELLESVVAGMEGRLPAMRTYVFSAWSSPSWSLGFTAVYNVAYDGTGLWGGAWGESGTFSSITVSLASAETTGSLDPQWVSLGTGWPNPLPSGVTLVAAVTLTRGPVLPRNMTSRVRTTSYSSHDDGGDCVTEETGETDDPMFPGWTLGDWSSGHPGVTDDPDLYRRAVVQLAGSDIRRNESTGAVEVLVDPRALLPSGYSLPGLHGALLSGTIAGVAGSYVPSGPFVGSVTYTYPEGRSSHRCASGTVVSSTYGSGYSDGGYRFSVSIGVSAKIAAVLDSGVPAEGGS